MKSILVIAATLISLLTSAQNVGIGTTTPTAKLHVNGNMKLEGASLLEFGAGIAGKEINAGKIGYNAFGTNALAIVGGGSNATNRAVYFFAEGGTTFSGPVTVGGTLKLNGDPGSAGQVLTSNGSGNPQWKNASFNNNTRFATYFSATGNGTPLTYTTRYNLNPTDITINANNISIHRTGLYHFDGFFKFRVGYSTNYTQAQAPEVSVFLDNGDSYNIAVAAELTPKTNYISVYPSYSYQQKIQLRYLPGCR